LINLSIRNLKILPRWIIVFIDIFCIALSSLIGYLLRFNFIFLELIHAHYVRGVIIYTSIGLLSIYLTGSYRGIIRYTGLQDGVRIFYTVLLNSILVLALNIGIYISYKFQLIPYSVIFISLLSSFLFLFNYRLLVKYVFGYYRGAIQKKFRVFIFGAGQTGIITRHVVESTPRMEVVGFLEDDPNKIGKILDGKKIYNAKTVELERLLEELSINEVIFTPKNTSPERKNEIVDICIKNQIKVRTVPPIEKWSKGELSFNQIKEINIEDLLERSEIKLDNPVIADEIKGKRILITGAAGSIGSELVRQVVKYSPQLLILIDQAESPLHDIEREIRRSSGGTKLISFLADVTNRERVANIFKDYPPDLVYHAAAYKHVPMMENNPSESISCNVLGTKIIADLSVEYRVKKFVMISTDKAVTPTNVMGCSKRIAEIYVQSLNNYLDIKGADHTIFVTTRFGNVLGSNGSVIPTFRSQILQGGPITVTHPEVTRYFMTIPEACELVLEASIMGRGGEIFIFDMGKSVKILDLAKKMISLSGLKVGKDIEIVFTGLREGEKLYEELLGTSENSIATHHNKIMIAKVEHYSYPEINRFIELFNDLLYDKNELKTVALMKELVPEFKSNYSRFEILDKQN
jgi:FlaA1/EpsC-like NDP-sugar epimerase